jgi:sensor histidine kinase YesM
MVVDTRLMYFSPKKLILPTIISTLYGVLIFMYLYYSEYGLLPSFTNHIDNISLFILCSWFIFSAMFFISRTYNRYMAWHKNVVLRFIIQFFTNLLIASFLILIAYGLFISLKTPESEAANPLADKGDAILKFVILFIVSNLIFVLVDFYQFSLTRFINANIESEKMVRQRLKLQFDVLKSQLSPHYLFNSLNTINSLIHKDAKTTEGFIRRFAHTFSYIFSSHTEDLIKVEEELRFIEAYVYLLYIRYENALQINIQLSEKTRQSYIPPLTLQLLIENAVKHNHLADEKPLCINIHDKTNGRLTVSNNFERKKGYIEVDNQMVKTPPFRVHSSKVGLENIKKRYHYFSSKEVLITRDTHFTVELPVLHKPEVNFSKEKTALSLSMN